MPCCMVDYATRSIAVPVSDDVRATRGSSAIWAGNSTRLPRRMPCRCCGRRSAAGLRFKPNALRGSDYESPGSSRISQSPTRWHSGTSRKRSRSRFWPRSSPWTRPASRSHVSSDGPEGCCATAVASSVGVPAGPASRSCIRSGVDSPRPRRWSSLGSSGQQAKQELPARSLSSTRAKRAPAPSALLKCSPATR